jgi:hypothetical protein
MIGLKNINKFKKLVKIHALDLTARTEWTDFNEAVDEDMSVPCFVGYIIYKDKHKTVITSDYDIDKNGITVGNRTVIPTKIIKKIEVMHEEKK